MQKRRLGYASRENIDEELYTDKDIEKRKKMRYLRIDFFGIAKVKQYGNYLFSQ